MISGVEVIAKYLEQEGIVLTFDYPDAAVCPFYDQLLQSSIQHVLVRQEQNAGHATSGYVCSSGRPGACIAISGSDATNLIAGITTAYMDSVPLIAITGQVRPRLFSHDVFQETDTTGACEPFTKHSYLVEDTADLPRVFREASHIAPIGRPGPVLTNVPVGVQQNQIKGFRYPQHADIIGYKPRAQEHTLQIKCVVEALIGAWRPLVYHGGGVVLTGTREELMGLVERAGTLVVSTMAGIGVVSLDSDSCLGMVGSHGKKGANQALPSADVAVLYGARADDRAVIAPEMLGNKPQTIHIDVDPTEIDKNIIAHIPTVGDIHLMSGNLANKMGNAAPQEWLNRVQKLRQADVPYGESSQGYVEPRSFMRMPSSMMKGNAILVVDVSQDQIQPVNNSNVKEERFLTSDGFGTMGYSIPAAIGVKPVEPRHQVVATCSDGSFQMSMYGLSTIMQSSIGVKIIAMANEHLGMVREIQDEQYGGRHMATEPYGNPDLVALARAYRIESAQVEDNPEAEGLIRKTLASNKPCLLVCKADPALPSI